MELDLLSPSDTVISETSFTLGLYDLIIWTYIYPALMPLRPSRLCVRGGQRRKWITA
jgi:hypothetical protein